MNLLNQAAQVTAENGARERRESVEHVMELYVLVKDDPLRIKLNSAVLAEARRRLYGESDTFSGNLHGADLWSWCMTVGIFLNRMRVNCRPCRSVASVCVHAEGIETAARLKIAAVNGRQIISINRRRLDSPTKRRRMTTKEASESEQVCIMKGREVEAATTKRNRLIHRSTYAEAIDLFLKVTGSNRAYILRESSEDVADRREKERAVKRTVHVAEMTA